jgi:MutL protein
VLPDVRAADTVDARQAVSRVFIGEVIAGKKLSASGRFGSLVAMATPDAVLRAAELLAAARPAAAGDGVLVTDIGGAITDVYWCSPAAR